MAWYQQTLQCPTWTCLTCHVTVETVTQFVAKHHKKTEQQHTRNVTICVDAVNKTPWRSVEHLSQCERRTLSIKKRQGNSKHTDGWTNETKIHLRDQHHSWISRHILDNHPTHTPHQWTLQQFISIHFIFHSMSRLCNDRQLHGIAGPPSATESGRSVMMISPYWFTCIVNLTNAGLLQNRLRGGSSPEHQMGIKKTAQAKINSTEKALTGVYVVLVVNHATRFQSPMIRPWVNTQQIGHTAPKI